MPRDNRTVLVTNLALLGVIGSDILGITMTTEESHLIMNVFHKVELSDEQLESLEVVTTEVYASMRDVYHNVFLMTYIIDGQLLPRKGTYVFLKLGFGLE